MADKKAKKKILFEKYKDENIANKEQAAIGKQYGIDTEKIVVKKESGTAKLITVLTEAVKIAIKVVLGLVVMGLVSFALTVLLNTQLRSAVFEIMKSW